VSSDPNFRAVEPRFDRIVRRSFSFSARFDEVRGSAISVFPFNVRHFISAFAQIVAVVSSVSCGAVQTGHQPAGARLLYRAPSSSFITAGSFEEGGKTVSLSTQRSNERTVIEVVDSRTGSLLEHADATGCTAPSSTEDYGVFGRKAVILSNCRICSPMVAPSYIDNGPAHTCRAPSLRMFQGVNPPDLASYAQVIGAVPWYKPRMTMNTLEALKVNRAAGIMVAVINDRSILVSRLDGTAPKKIEIPTGTFEPGSLMFRYAGFIFRSNVFVVLAAIEPHKMGIAPVTRVVLIDTSRSSAKTIISTHGLVGIAPVQGGAWIFSTIPNSRYGESTFLSVKFNGDPVVVSARNPSGFNQVFPGCGSGLVGISGDAIPKVSWLRYDQSSGLILFGRPAAIPNIAIAKGDAVLDYNCQQDSFIVLKGGEGRQLYIFNARGGK